MVLDKSGGGFGYSGFFGGEGTYCSPVNAYCDDSPFGGIGIAIVYGGRWHGDGGSASPSAPSGGSRSTPRIGGTFPNGETSGIPNGVSLQPLSIWQLLNMVPVGQGCEFGPCEFQVGTIAWGTRIATAAKAGMDIASGGLTLALNILLMQKGDASPIDNIRRLPQSIQNLIASCTPGNFVSEPSTTYPGGISYEQEYICPTGLYTVHWIMQNDHYVHGPHIRPGPPKGGVGP